MHDHKRSFSGPHARTARQVLACALRITKSWFVHQKEQAQDCMLKMLKMWLWRIESTRTRVGDRQLIFWTTVSTARTRDPAFLALPLA